MKFHSASSFNTLSSFLVLLLPLQLVNSCTGPSTAEQNGCASACSCPMGSTWSSCTHTSESEPICCNIFGCNCDYTSTQSYLNCDLYCKPMVVGRNCAAPETGCAVDTEGTSPGSHYETFECNNDLPLKTIEEAIAEGGTNVAFPCHYSAPNNVWSKTQCDDWSCDDCGSRRFLEIMEEAAAAAAANKEESNNTNTTTRPTAPTWRNKCDDHSLWMAKTDEERLQHLAGVYCDNLEGTVELRFLQELMIAADLNGDGEVDCDEFEDMSRDPELLKQVTHPGNNCKAKSDTSTQHWFLLVEEEEVMAVLDEDDDESISSSPLITTKVSLLLSAGWLMLAVGMIGSS